ncbi:MAG TPA: hypothetical protein VEJ40_08945 [Pseudolabrys sp.]|jgi:hypothetical protein|nr:hypothetical protein [Pseudolabrys sp.]
MRKLIHAVLVLALIAPAVALAASAEDFNAVLAKAEAANKQAGALKNQWTTTGQAIAAAKKAAEAGKFDDAVKFAQHAEELAQASIAQAKEQETAWTKAVIR